jgi:predicted hotdog family 3-hydroxylacyl-ACP dehydratase
VTFPPLSELITHRGPSVLLDRVLDAEPQSIRCGARIAAGHPYERAGAVPAIVMLEMMAQAIAAQVGLSGRHRGLAPRMGYLVSVRQLALHVVELVPPLELAVHARLAAGRADAAAFRCRVESERGDRLYASTVMTVFQPAAAR